MKSQCEVQGYINAMNSVRNLSKSFLSMVDENDLHRCIEINGKTFNSPYWITAHLAWSEGLMLLTALGKDPKKHEWLNEYGFGTNPLEIKTRPPYNEALKVLDDVHNMSMENLNNMYDYELDEKNVMNMTFDGKKDKRISILHAIRHEPMHIGQITWFLKSTGKETY